MKRILSCLLLLVLISSCTVAFAAVQPRASELIVDRFIYAYAYGNGEVEFSVDMTTLRAVDKLGFPSIKLQEKQGSSWVTVKSATSMATTGRITVTPFPITARSAMSIESLWNTMPKMEISPTRRARPAAL